MAAKREKCEAPALAGASRRMMRALVKRAAGGELEALEALFGLQGELAQAIQDGVDGYRQGPAAASWTDIGRVMGTTRQAAQIRFGGTKRPAAAPNEADALIPRELVQA